MKKAVSKENAAFYNWGNNCSSWILNDAALLSVKLELMPAGAREQLHYHQNARQFFFMLKGVASFYIEDEIIEVKEQEGVSIDPNQKHFVVNETNEPIEFLVISQPSTKQDRITV